MLKCSRNQLLARHKKLFANMQTYGSKLMNQAGQELMTEVVRLHSSTYGGSGVARLSALRKSDFPFASRHGAPLWGTPPVGSISGALRASLRVTTSSIQIGQTTVKAASVGNPYAKFVYAPYGTSKMAARGVILAANTWAEARMIRLGKDWMAIQLRLL